MKNKKMTNIWSEYFWEARGRVICKALEENDSLKL